MFRIDIVRTKFYNKPRSGVNKILRVATLKGEQLNGDEEAAVSCDTRLNIKND